MATAFRNIILTLLILLLLPIASAAETEINVTLEDNVVFLLDYSWGIWDDNNYQWFYIKSNVKKGLKDSNVKSNISIIAYGYGNSTKSETKVKTILNYSDLEDFLQFTLPQSFDGHGDDLYQAFSEAKNILDNITGSKQIILISNGNIDGKTGFEKLENAPLIDLINNLKKNNIKINLYQVLDVDYSQKENQIIQAYNDLGKGTNTNIIILNRSERLHFVNREIEKPLKPLIYGVKGEYTNELFSNNETALVIFSMKYRNKYEMSFFESYTAIDFYRYCDDNCVIIPIGRNGGIFNEQTMSEIFRGKNAIEMVRSGNITDSAYFISNPITGLCGFFEESDTFDKEIKNSVGEIASSVSEFRKPMKTIRAMGIISKTNIPMLYISAECNILSYDDLPEKIIDGGRYTYNLKTRIYYNGMTNDFKNYNDFIIKSVEERKKDIVKRIIFIFNEPINYQPSVEKIGSNNIQLSKLLNTNYSENVSLATKQINKKMVESDILIERADNQIKELDRQINNGDSKEVQNLKEAREYLNAAKQNQTISKFNTAIINANKSREKAREGMRESKNKPIPNLSIAMGITAFIFVAVLIKRKMKT